MRPCSMIAVPKNARATLMTRLAAAPLVHAGIRRLRLQDVAKRLFSVLPIKRRLKNSGLTYRVRHLESLLVADEIFVREIYGRAFEDRDVRTFVDVGSNVGYFGLYVAERTGRRDTLGLLVDGNEDMVREAQWHVDHAELRDLHVVHG